MLPRVNANGRPGKSAIILAALGCSSTGGNYEQTFAQCAISTGSEQLYWFRDPNDIQVNWVCWRNGNELWINTYGTENGPQILAYASTLIPLRDTTLGTWVMPWAMGQANHMLSRITRWITQYSINRVVICGHSLGGAVAHYVGCLTKALQSNLQPVVEVLTFGEPRCLASGSLFNPDVHFRIVSVSGGGANDEADPVTLLPPNALVVPIIGVASRVASALASLVRLEVGFTPVHYGEGFYVTNQGEYVDNPYSSLGSVNESIINFVNQTFIGAISGEQVLESGQLRPFGPATNERIRLHFMLPTYLGAALRIYLSGSGEELPLIEHQARELLNFGTIGQNGNRIGRLRNGRSLQEIDRQIEAQQSRRIRISRDYEQRRFVDEGISNIEIPLESGFNEVPPIELNLGQPSSIGPAYGLPIPNVNPVPPVVPQNNEQRSGSSRDLYFPR